MKYTIKEGNHRSGIYPFGLTFATKITKKVKFTCSCKYDLGDSDQYDINKLFGLSDAWSHHHKNSARFGWRYDVGTNKINIYSYIYKNGLRYNEFITHVSIGQYNVFTLEVTKNTYKFTVNNLTTVISRISTSKFSLRYELYPYFGGNRVAPHTMTIIMKEPTFTKTNRILCQLTQE